jgi:hypothetical protein
MAFASALYFFLDSCACSFGLCCGDVNLLRIVLAGNAAIRRFQNKVRSDCWKQNPIHGWCRGDGGGGGGGAAAAQVMRESPNTIG